MKQSSDVNCVAACLAMIVGETERYVLDWFDFPGPYGGVEIDWFLLYHGYRAGLCIDLSGMPVTDEVGFEVKVPIAQPALVTVKSERFPNSLHQLFWDGRKVWDPNPGSADNRPLSSYKVLQWGPLMRTPQRTRYEMCLEYKKNKTALSSSRLK